MSLIHSFFPLLPLISSFPSHIHVHETCTITKRQLFCVKKTKPEARGILAVSEKKSKILSIVQQLHLMWLNILLPILRYGCQDNFRVPKCGNDSTSLGTVVTPFPRDLDTALLYRTRAQSCTVLSFSGGDLYNSLALYAQGDIKGNSAFSGDKKNVVLNLSLNLELSVWIKPSGNNSKRIRLSL